MFTERDLQELLKYKSRQSVLSVYLNTDPTEGSADAYRLRLRTMLKDVELEEDIAAIERFFDFDYDWSGRSVVIFSCQPEGFFRSYSFAFPIRDRLRIGERPHVKPLANLLDAYGSYGVALVDKQDARLFYFHLGELREEEALSGEAVRRTKQGGGSQAPGRRGGTAGQTKYVEEVTERNIKEAADLAARFFGDNNVRRVLIGGTEENSTQFRSHLPKAWQSLVVGTFPVSMIAGQAEVLQRALEVGGRAERQSEAELVKKVVTTAAKGRGGVVDLEDTLNAVHDGRVQILVIRDGYRAPGFRCQGCGYLTSEEIDTCPFCGNCVDRIPDAAELAVRRVMREGGEVEVVQDSESLKEFGNIGALLRY